jgi:DNA-binding LytR/AlgR family response regulator
MKQMTLYRRFAAEAKEATEEIQVPDPPAEATISLATAPEKIFLRGDNQKEELALLPNELLFLASADNYVNVCYRNEGGLKSVLLRGSLKKFEEQLADQPGFFRCHRMYLVNLQAVADVSGNAQGLKLHLLGLEEAIPVSRNLTETVKEKLHHLSRSPQNA